MIQYKTYQTQTTGNFQEELDRWSKDGWELVTAFAHPFADRTLVRWIWRKR